MLARKTKDIGAETRPLSFVTHYVQTENLAQSPAKSIRYRAIVVQPPRRRRFLKGSCFHELLGIKGLVPLVHILHCRKNIGFAVNQIQRREVDIFVNAFVMFITCGHVPKLRSGLVIENGSFHSEWSENLLFKKLSQRFTGNLLDYLPQNDIPRIAVFVSCSGSESEYSHSC